MIRHAAPNIPSVLLAALVLLGGAASPARADAPARPPAAVDFNRDVQPILSENCYFCHGTDKAQRKADLRLDKLEDATRDLGKGRRAVVPGRGGESEIIKRMTSGDPDEVMPPRESHREVTPQQIETLKRWIDEGAKWGVHWSFVPPARPELPKVSDAGWVRNPVDAFILARLEAEGLRPSPPAPKEKLIRRVTLDLTGLPPTPEEVDAFAPDPSSDAYEKLVDRLLASPRYGERMVVDWLDAARYADTNGYQGDPTRSMWPWRDWAARAMNANVPYDRFVTEQLAGDLLPDATDEQRVATAFNRNHTYNGEGGRIAEETRVENVMDRTETLGTVFLGLTIGCTRCHDHKYDPLTQREYFGLYAYFNQTSESGTLKYDTLGNAPPTLTYTPADRAATLAQLRAARSAAEAALAAALPEVDAEQERWQQHVTSDGSPATEWEVLVPASVTSRGGSTFTTLADGSVLGGGANLPTDVHEVVLRTDRTKLTGLRLEVLGHESLPGGGPGRGPSGGFALNVVEAAAVSVRDPQRSERVAFAAAQADFAQKGFGAAGAIDADPNTYWTTETSPHKDVAARLTFARPLGFEGGTELRLTFRYESPRYAYNLGRFRLAVTHEPIVTPDVAAALSKPRDGQDDAQRKLVRDFFRSQISARHRELSAAATTARNAAQEAEAALPRVMVMDEKARRDTFLLTRGAYDKPGDKVDFGVPAVLHPLPPDAPKNRLGLARWLADPANPLLARVTVNRYWQAFFGTGLVKTSDDFGLQGEKPSHPELLDWLAVQFREGVGPGGAHPWDVKAIHRLIVTSNAYRQSSKVTPDLLERDPANRLLARGPRYRMSSFMIRDQALAASGLLVGQVGGPPVKPYQPPGVWEEMSLDQIKYAPDAGDALYRRSLYTFWRRTVAPTTMFDVPARTVCSVRQVRTNTPLHALALLNDTTYVEAARVLAERLLLDKAKTDEQRLEQIFRLVTARKPAPAEAQVLTSSLARLRTQYAADKDAAAKLLSVGERPRDASLDAGELAAWTTVASMVMNLDEAITQE